MKKVDYLFESANPGGTYASLILSPESAADLYEFCVGLGIENLVDPDDYHCTVLYSRKAVPEIDKEDFRLPCPALMTSFKVLGNETKVLVAEIYCPNARRLHNLFKDKYGATHDYDEFIPHITVAADFEGDVPKALTDKEIRFSERCVEELEE